MTSAFLASRRELDQPDGTAYMNSVCLERAIALAVDLCTDAKQPTADV
jgi:hypothetical protein